MLCVSMKILSHHSAKKKTEIVMGFQFCTYGSFSSNIMAVKGLIGWRFWTLQLTLVSRADFHVVRSFLTLHSDVIKVSLTSRKLSVLRAGHGWNSCGLQLVLSPIVLSSVQWTSDDSLHRSRQEQQQELIDDRLYNAILRSLEQTHCARMWFYMSE